jgi:hypothetical protein
MMPTDPDNITPYWKRPKPPDAQATKTSRPASMDDGRYWPQCGSVAFDPRDVARREQLFAEALGERVNLRIDFEVGWWQREAGKINRPEEGTPK